MLAPLILPPRQLLRRLQQRLRNNGASGQTVLQHVLVCKQDSKEISFLEIKIKKSVARNDVHIGVNGKHGHFVIKLVEVENRRGSEDVLGSIKIISRTWLKFILVNLVSQHLAAKVILWRRQIVMITNVAASIAVNISHFLGWFFIESRLEYLKYNFLKNILYDIVYKQ